MILKLAEKDKEPSFFQIVGVTIINDGEDIVYKTTTNESKKKNIKNLFVVELLSDDGLGLINKYK